MQSYFIDCLGTFPLFDGPEWLQYRVTKKGIAKMPLSRSLTPTRQKKSQITVIIAFLQNLCQSSLAATKVMFFICVLL